MKKLFILTALLALGFGGFAQANLLKNPPVIKKSSYKKSVLKFYTKSGVKKTPSMSLSIPVKNKRTAFLGYDSFMCDKRANPNCVFEFDLNSFVYCQALNCPTTRDVKKAISSGQKFNVRIVDRSASGSIKGKIYSYQLKNGSLKGVVKSTISDSDMSYGPWLR